MSAVLRLRDQYAARHRASVVLPQPPLVEYRVTIIAAPARAWLRAHGPAGRDRAAAGKSERAGVCALSCRPCGCPRRRPRQQRSPAFGGSPSPSGGRSLKLPQIGIFRHCPAAGRFGKRSATAGLCTYISTLNMCSAAWAADLRERIFEIYSCQDELRRRHRGESIQASRQGIFADFLYDPLFELQFCRHLGQYLVDCFDYIVGRRLVPAQLNAHEKPQVVTRRCFGELGNCIRQILNFAAAQLA